MRLCQSASFVAGLFTLALIGAVDRPAAQPLNKLPPARAVQRFERPTVPPFIL
jgi:hypothetical protein